MIYNIRYFDSARLQNYSMYVQQSYILYELQHVRYKNT